MEFGVVMEVSVPRPFDDGVEARVYGHCLEQIRLADELGFATVWAVEHHFLEEYSHCSAPELLLAAAAVQTDRIRLGHGIVVCVPEFNHPIRVAERVGVLDILSKGRVDVGTGRSSTWTELGGFAADPDDTKKTWDEYVHVLPKMWTQERFSHKGRAFSMPERAILPKPVQKPHPPMWVAVTSPGTELDAADRGLGSLGLAFGGFADQEKRIATYRRRIQQCEPVGSFVNEKVATVNFLMCQENLDTAARRGRQLSRTFGYLAAQQLFAREAYPSRSYPTAGLLPALRRDASGPGDLSGIPEGVAIGDPERLITELRRWEDVGVDQVNFILNCMEVVPQQEVLDSLRLFAAEVMPKFQTARISRVRPWGKPVTFTDLISADGHVEEAPDLWSTRLPKSYRHRAPTIERGPDGQRMLFIEGQAKGIPGLSINRGERKGAYDVQTRVEDLDAQDIAVEVLYPQWTMILYQLGIDEPAYEYELLHAYNSWLAEFCAAAPGRFLGIALLPIHDVELAIKELDHVMQLGLPGVNIPQSRPEIGYNASSFAPFWDAVDASGLPVSIHAGLIMEHRGPGAVAANVTRNLSSFRNSFPILIFSGLLDRHPTMKVVLTEGGIGWLASALYDMDMINEQYHQHIGPELSAKPSEIWRRQCFATFQDDPAGMRCIDMIGPSTVLWGADYPHPEGTFPHTREIVEKQFADVDPEEAEAILGGNAPENLAQLIVTERDHDGLQLKWGDVTEVVLDRPERKNAIDMAMQRALRVALDKAASDDAVRVVLLRGEGPCFSSGHDLAEVAGKDLGSDHYFDTARFYTALWEFPKPLIVAAQGVLGPGAVEIVMLADLAVAAESTVLNYEVYRGGGMTAGNMLPWVVGPREAKRILFTAPVIHAAEARDLGIFLRVVADDVLVERTTALARLVAAMPPLHLQLAKAAVNQCVESMGRPAATAFATAAEALIRERSTALEDLATKGLKQLLADQRARFEPLIRSWLGE